MSVQERRVTMAVQERRVTTACKRDMEMKQESLSMLNIKINHFKLKLTCSDERRNKRKKNHD